MNRHEEEHEASAPVASGRSMLGIVAVKREHRMV
jgi:hypothetical protein